MRTLIIIIMITVVAATAVTITLGTMTFEGTVVKDPYETGLRWDAVQRKQRESGWSVVMLSRVVRKGRNDIPLRVQDRSGRELRDATVALRLDRPSTGAPRAIAKTSAFKDGSYHAFVDIPEPGGWTATIVVSRGAETVEFQDTLFAE